jgi:hypothetical protein
MAGAMHPARLTKSVVGLINGRRKAAAIAMAAGIRAAMPNNVINRTSTLTSAVAFWRN